ncbi:PTS transporter subunit EIIC [Kitasatospora sp. NPDC052896]|uniref:PTS transporter subunit EIIC n=1 Tax=Kitasatospora sp. NPDC052896 TaxID=3364061 RepID=UPI0037C8A9DF
MADGPHRATAAAVLTLVGGPDNVTSLAHCLTRLRLGVRDRELVREAELAALPAVLGVIPDDTYQIVLGPGVVDRVSAEFAQLLTDRPRPVDADELAHRGAALRTEQRARNATPGRLLLHRIADVFVPLIPALIGCGVVSGLNGLLVNLGWLPSLVPALGAIGAAFLSLIVVFVGYQTAQVFGGTPVIGGAVAAVIVYPGVAGVSVLGTRLSPGQGGVLGALGAALLAVWLEKRFRRLLPGALEALLTPTLTVLITGLVTLFGLMYAAGRVSAAVGTGVGQLLSHGGLFTGLLLGGLFLPLVTLGLHQALIPIHTTLIAQQGATPLLPILAMAGAGQVGAAIAIYLRLPRNPSLRATIRSALPAGLLGVGEPLIYGVSLPLGRPFVTACLGGAAGGALVGLFDQLGSGVGATAIGPSGWALFPLLKGGHGPAATAAVYAAGLAAGYLTGFLATYCFGFTPAMLTTLNATPAGEPTDVH